MKNFTGQTFCFLGRSGSGKDTQGDLLHKTVELGGNNVVHISTGDEARNLKRRGTAVGSLIKRILDKGELFPDWLADSLWMCVIQNQLMPGEVVILDGTPRRVGEARLLDEVMIALDRPLPVPIYLDVTEEEARRRLLARARADDKLDVINKRLSWFQTDVLPILDFYGDRVVKIVGHGDPDKEVFIKLISQI